MRTLVLLAMVVGLFVACSHVPGPEGTPEPEAPAPAPEIPVPEAPAPSKPIWLTDSPMNAHAYSDKMLAQFRKLVEGEAWRDAAWNAQGTLEAVHEKTGQAFVLVPAGSFLMGSPVSEAEREDDETQYKVTVPAFLLCKTECTQAAWVRGGGSNPSYFKGDSLPVEQVSWNDSQAWCQKLGLRLPSESEWEYACRAGTETPFATGETLTTAQANYDGNYPYGGGRKGEFRKRPVKAGSLPANPWGLHEMPGNVWEWCGDWYAMSYDMTPRDGSAHSARSSGFRVRRGGGWGSLARGCRSAVRGRNSHELRLDYLGFRPASNL
jgi:formylglycine-generating enzyme required for sulfatase activity